MFELYLLIFLLLVIVSIMITTLQVGISPMPSSKKASQAILENIRNSKEDIVIDLGSGFGNLAIFLASNLPNKKVIGYELSFVPWLVSIFLTKLLRIKNLKFYRKNFYKQELKNAALVCYLYPKAMEKLEDKIFDETINTKIVSSTFAFRNIKARDTILLDDFYRTPIYIYET